MNKKDQQLLQEAYQKILEASYGPIAGAASRAETNPGIVGKDGKLVQGAAAMDRKPGHPEDVQRAAMQSQSPKEFAEWLQNNIPNIHPNVIQDLLKKYAPVIGKGAPDNSHMEADLG